MGLGREREVRFSCVADLSLRYTTILAITIVVCLGLVALSIVPGDLLGNEELTVILLLVASIAGPIGAVIFMIWKWLEFVRIGRGFRKDELGFSKFKHLKRCFVFAVVVTLLLMGFHAGEISISKGLVLPATVILLVFDSFVMTALLVFVPLAWHIGCTIPLRVYLEISVMLIMFCFQIFMILW